MLTAHGGDLTGFLEDYGRLPLDFSANVSPLGLPDGVRQAVVRALDTAGAYPDPLCRSLRAAIAAFEGCPPEFIRCGAGAADLIFQVVLAQRPKTALVTAPTFSEYENALRLTGCAVTRHLLRPEEDFCLTDRFLSDLAQKPDMVFLCQPNNPTGQPMDPALLEQIRALCRENGSLLVLDECFTELMEEPERYSLKKRLGGPELLILKAFTKTYSMAGLRLGYCLTGNRTLLEEMAACTQPWGVSSLAQAAGIAALGESAYRERLRRLIAQERPVLSDGLTALGCSVTGSKANFLFFSAWPGLDRQLREKGILIRSCSNYPGLTDRYYRVAVRTHPDTLRLLDAVRQCKEELPWQTH